jgi:hypothetical protein
MSQLEPMNLSKPQFHWSCSSPLRRGEHNTSHNNLQRQLHNLFEVLNEIMSSKSFRRRQPPRVTNQPARLRGHAITTAMFHILTTLVIELMSFYLEVVVGLSVTMGWTVHIRNLFYIDMFLLTVYMRIKLCLDCKRTNPPS